MIRLPSTWRLAGALGCLGCCHSTFAEWGEPVTIDMQAFQAPVSLELSDVDLDGDADILLAAPRWDDDEAYLFYFERQGNGPLTGPQQIATLAGADPRARIEDRYGERGALAVAGRQWVAPASTPGLFREPVALFTEAPALDSDRIDDVDGDGILDLYGFDPENQALVVYRGLADGGAEALPVVDSPFEEGVTPLLVGPLTDADGDGDRDQLVGAGEALWLLQNGGDGTFAFVDLELPYTSAPFWLEVDDDALPGLLTAEGTELQWRRNLGDLEFDEVNRLLEVDQGEVAIMEVADANGDELADVAVRVGDEIGWVVQTNGVFELVSRRPFPSDLQSGDYLQTTSDYNDDGFPDFVFAERSFSGMVVIMLNDESGGLLQPQIVLTPALSSINGIISVTTNDFDRDGLLDVAAAQSVGGEMVWYKNQGGGRFSAARRVGPSPSISPVHSIHSADFNDDGAAEIVHLPAGTNELFVEVNSGLGVFARISLGTMGTEENVLTGLLVDDFSGDGRADIVCATQEGVFLFRDVRAGQIGFQGAIIDAFAEPEMTGEPLLVRYLPTQTVPHILVPTSDELLFYRWNGQAFAPLRIANAMPALNPSLVLGLDDDPMNVDLVSDGVYLHRLSLQNALGNERQLPPAGVQPVSGDVNDDGIADLIGIGDEQPLWYEGAEDGSFADGVPVVAGTLVGDAIALGDLDGNERPDLIVGNDRQLIWIPNNAPDLVLDSDEDGLPDAWEEEQFENLDQSPEDVVAGTGQTAFALYAFGGVEPTVAANFRGGAVPAVVFSGRRVDPGLRFTVEVSRDLISWSTLWRSASDLFNPLITQVLASNVETEVVAVRGPVPDGAPVFFRIRAEKPAAVPF